MDQSNERRDLSVETTWNAMLDLEKQYTLLFLWVAMTTQELQDLKNSTNALATESYRRISDSYSQDSWTDQPLDDSVERVRPFLGEALYDIFKIHRVVVVRSSFALCRVVCDQSDQPLV